MNATISFKLFLFFYFKFLFQKYFLCLCILYCFLASNLFAYDDIDHEAEAENRAYPFIVKKERELKSKNISAEEKEYILDCYKIEIIAEKYCDSLYEDVNLHFGYYINIADMHFRYKAWDKLLNKYYNLYKKLLNYKQKNALLKEQRIWLKMRDIFGHEYGNAMTDFDILIYGAGTMDQHFEVTHADTVGFLIERVETLFNYYKDYKQKRKVNNTGYSYKWNHIFDNDLIRSNPSTARHFLKKIDNENSQWTLVMKQIPVGHSYKWNNDLDVDETSALSLYSQNLNDFLNGDKPIGVFTDNIDDYRRDVEEALLKLRKEKAKIKNIYKNEYLVAYREHMKEVNK